MTVAFDTLKAAQRLSNCSELHLSGARIAIIGNFRSN